MTPLDVPATDEEPNQHWPRQGEGKFDLFCPARKLSAAASAITAKDLSRRRLSAAP